MKRGSAYHIRQYLQLRKDDRTGVVIKQIDRCADLCAELLSADCLAVFYQREASDGLVPVAVCCREKDGPTEFGLLEYHWQNCANDRIDELATTPSMVEKINEAHSGEAHSDEAHSDEAHPGEAHSDESRFAVANKYNHVYRYVDDSVEAIRMVVIAFWSEEPASFAEGAPNNLARAANVMAGVIAMAEMLRDSERYFLRLPELTELFDIPLTETKFRDLQAHIADQVVNVLPVEGACLLQRKRSTGRFSFGATAGRNGKVEPPLGILSLFDSATVSEVSDLLGSDRVVDLSSPLRCRDRSVVAVSVSPAERQQIIMVIWTEGGENLADLDRELLMIFGCFARAVIANALLIRNIRKANRLLRRSSARLANFETMAALTDMTTGVADELNNAIGGVIGRIQLLREKLSDKDHQRDLALIEELIIPTTDTIKRIQQFVSAAQSKDFEATDLVRVVSEVVADTDCKWSEMADARGVEVVISCCCEDAVISGFEPDLRLILDKLLDNAVEHSPENGTVEIALISNEKGYQLSVSDQGSGVASINRDRIFYPFFTTKEQRGAGMSLAIVHGVVVRHGGTVLVSDNEDHGAIFTIAFPHQVNVEDTSEITGKIQIPAKRRVLIVDDDEQIREVLSDMIQMDGHEITTCCDAYAALEEIANGEYDLLITDLGMPGMSGLDLARVVHEKLPGLPVAMITGWGTQLNEDEVKAKGIKRVLAKPFHLKDIKALVADLVC